jgi:hypothetical protein
MFINEALHVRIDHIQVFNLHKYRWLAQPVLAGWRGHTMTHHAIIMVRNITRSSNPHDDGLLLLRDPVGLPDTERLSVSAGATVTYADYEVRIDL